MVDTVDIRSRPKKADHRVFVVFQCVRSGLNFHYFHIVGDGHQPHSRGLYTHYKDSLLKVG